MEEFLRAQMKLAVLLQLNLKTKASLKIATAFTIKYT